MNYNGSGFVESAVASALSDSPRLCEVILVDNGSTDGSPEAIRQAYPGVRILRFPENRGFAEAANEGYRSANAPIVVFLNSDARLPPHWVDTVATEFDNDPTLVCLTVAIHNISESENAHSGATFNVLGTRIPEVWHDDSRVWGPSGAAFALHKSRFPLSNPFPSHFFAYYEDFILGAILRHRRLQVRKLSSLIVEHENARTARKLSRAFLRFLQERNRVSSLIATFSTATLLKLFPLFVLDLLMRFMRSLVERDFMGFILAHLHLTFGWVRLARLRWQVRGPAPVPDPELLPFLSGKLHPQTPFLNSLSLAYLRTAGLRVAEHSFPQTEVFH
ncbi:MAG: glycosyltransferase family 2 protein [bacterium JZ-2024 1]